MEVFWTGIGSVLNRDPRAVGSSSLWMFLIYGLAGFLEPVCSFIIDYPWFARGLVYMACFFGIEFAAGLFLRQVNACPWDYSGVRLNLLGLIRLDYAPVWFAAGLIFERVYLLMRLKGV